LETINSIKDLKVALSAERARANTIGFVPTMGYLHEGHTSLISNARKTNDIVITSIFVNPLQFSENEDLNTYPSDIEADTTKAINAGCDFLFTPSVSQMYPSEQHTSKTKINVSDLAKSWEGSLRPGHFEGVATVVNKLLNIVGPCSVYFGEKDFQQLQIVKQMVSDLSIDASVIQCETIRDRNGLALSSRNSYLDAAQKQQASVLYQSLQAAAKLVEIGESDPSTIEEFCRNRIISKIDASVDYIGVVDPKTLQVPDKIVDEVRILAAINFADVRLLDNIGCSPCVTK